MSDTKSEKSKRKHRLTDLSNVVLINGRSAESSQSYLEQKLMERVDKEFPNPSRQEKVDIEAVKNYNMQFAKRMIKQQKDGEYFIQVQENVREKDIHLFYKFNDKNLDLMEMLVMGDTLVRAGVGSITLYLPYIPYQRQDKKDEGRVPISAKLIFNLLLASMGNRLKRVVTFDLHAKQAQAHFDGPVDELSAIPEFAAYYRNKFKEDLARDSSSVVVFSPDAGGAKRAEKLSELLQIQYQVLTKRRIGHGKAETKYDTYDTSVNVNGKRIIIIDDMIDSGSSLVGEYENGKDGPVQYFQSLGADVYCCATHHVLSEKDGIKAEERLRKSGVPFLFTDSIPEKYPGYYTDNKDYMSVLSLNYPLAKAVYCNAAGESISQFLKDREKKLRADKLDLIDQGDGQINFEESNV